VAATQGVFAEQGMEAFDQSPIERLFVPNTVEPRIPFLSSRVEMVPVGRRPTFGKAIRRIHQRDSISVLFD
jgi:ribose-phosphate pyrophosphokinase